jgi:hypothetical protein
MYRTSLVRINKSLYIEDLKFVPTAKIHIYVGRGPQALRTLPWIDKISERNGDVISVHQFQANLNVLPQRCGSESDEVASSLSQICQFICLHLT